MKSRMTYDFLELHLPAHDMEKKIEGRKILNFNVINVIYFEVRKSLFLSPWNCYHMIYLSVYTLNRYYRRIQTCLHFYRHLVSETSYMFMIWIHMEVKNIWRFNMRYIFWPCTLYECLKLWDCCMPLISYYVPDIKVTCYSS